MSLQGRCVCACPPVVFPQAAAVSLIRGEEHVENFLQAPTTKNRHGAVLTGSTLLSWNTQTNDNWTTEVG